MTLAALGYLANRLYFSGGVCKNKKRLDGRIVIITGANSGIGFETALELASRGFKTLAMHNKAFLTYFKIFYVQGAHVILACRNEKLANESADHIKLESKNENVIVELVNLSDLQSVRYFAKRIQAKYDHIDILINNAGTILLKN